MPKPLVRKDAAPASLLQRWPRPTRARAAFAAGFALAWAITGLAIWQVASAPGTGPNAPASRTLLILALAFTVGARVVRLVRQRTDAGARLHLRFVILFGGAAALPAVIVALIFGVLVTRGVESWFSKDVRTSVENGRIIGRDYIQGVSDEMTSNLQAMTGELRQIRPLFPNRMGFSNALTALAEFRGYTALYLVSGDGTVLARGETANAPPYLAPPASALQTVAAGGAAPAMPKGPDALRTL